MGNPIFTALMRARQAALGKAMQGFARASEHAIEVMSYCRFACRRVWR